VTVVRDDLLENYYFQIADIWKAFCEKHNELLELTGLEYSHMLSSEIEKLEDSVKEKQVIIEDIGELDKQRQALITEINKTLEASEKIQNASDLLRLMQNLEIEKEQKHLFRFNALLIDIIGKIQAQNKKNQLFLNKAIRSLKEIRLEATGSTSLELYNSKGNSLSRAITKEIRA
jgi:transcriptional regulator of NAD metabolism